MATFSFSRTMAGRNKPAITPNTTIVIPQPTQNLRLRSRSSLNLACLSDFGFSSLILQLRFFSDGCPRLTVAADVRRLIFRNPKSEIRNPKLIGASTIPVVRGTECSPTCLPMSQHGLLRIPRCALHVCSRCPPVVPPPLKHQHRQADGRDPAPDFEIRP